MFMYIIYIDLSVNKVYDLVFIILIIEKSESGLLSKEICMQNFLKFSTHVFCLNYDTRVRQNFLLSDLNDN